jgi:hypothetical protein
VSIRLGATLAAIVAAGAAAVAVPSAAALPAGHPGQPAAVPSPGICSVDYQLNQWSGGFTAAVALTNNGPEVSSWTLSWTFGGDQHVTAFWNVALTQTGPAASAASLAYNGHLGTGASTTFGFQGTNSGTNAVPADFALNGVSCGGSASPTSSPSPSPTTSTGTGGQCPAGVVFCDGFEDQSGTTPAGRWTVGARDCSGTGTAAVDTAVAHTGTKSLRVDGTDGYCNHVFVSDSADLATGSPVWYVRLWVRHTTALPTGHVTVVAMNDSAAGNTDLRLGGQNGALMWNRQTDDATLPAQSPAGVAQSLPLPVNTWTCLEYGVDGTTGTLSSWVDGTAVAGLTEDGVPTQDIDAQWLSGAGASWRPHLTDLRLGWESYGGGGADTVWFDDVALATARIGC